MFAGTKRSRAGDGESAGTSEGSCPPGFQHMATELDEVITNVGSVNSAVLQAVVQKARQLQQALGVSRDSNAKLWRQVSQCQESRAVTALSHVRMVDDCRQQLLSARVAREQLEKSASLAVCELTDSFDAASRTTVAMFSSQLEGEQLINEQLVERVQNLLRGALEAVHLYSRRALDAELLALKKDVTIARLQSSICFCQNASLRHREEVLSLIDIVRILAAKGKDADRAHAQLQQAKAHVRLLEKHLDLAGIVHAIVPPEFVPARPRVEPPNVALQRSAPEYFALRLLQHHDMTLSELVDAWQKQESRIAEVEGRYAALEESVATMRREALTVHEQFIEERRRREVVEHRLADLVRQRLHPSSGESLTQQLTQLRIDYTKVLDDSVQMATSLNLAREKLAEEKMKREELQREIQQLRDDTDADRVAQAVAALRHYYEEEVSRLRDDTVNAETQRTLAVAHAEAEQRATRDVKEALKLTEQTVKGVSSVLQRTTAKGREGDGGQCSAEAVLQVDRLVKEVNETVSRSEAHFQKAVNSFESVLHAQASQRREDLRAFEQQVLRLIATFESLQPRSSNADLAAGDSSKIVEMMVEKSQHQEIRSLLRETLAQTLHFVTNKLETSQLTETNLLDAAIEDGQNVSALLDKVREVTKERDLALSRLARCEQLIDQQGLMAVDRVLMQEGPVDNSLDAVEASEQIATMREQLTSLEAVRAAAVAEVAVLQKEKQGIAENAERMALQLELLRSHNDDLLSALRQHLSREVNLVEQLNREQRQVQQLAGGGDAALAPSGPEQLADDIKGPLGRQLEELCNGFAAVKEQLGQLWEVMPGNAEEKEDIEGQLLRSGVRQVADTLRKALQNAELFRHSLQVEPPAFDGVGETEEKDEVSRNADTAPASEGNKVTSLQEQLAEAMEKHEILMRERDEELARLRGELAASVNREELLRREQESLREQNTDIQEKVARLLHINKQLVERIKSSSADEVPQQS